MKSKKVVVIIIVLLAIVAIACAIIVISNSNSNEYTDYENTEYFPNDPTDLSSKLEADVNGEDVVFTFDIDEYYDYYVGMYIRSALREYLASNGVSDVTFSISVDLYCVTPGDPTNIVGEYECSNGDIIVIYMHRDTDTWEWEIK